MPGNSNKRQSEAKAPGPAKAKKEDKGDKGDKADNFKEVNKDIHNAANYSQRQKDEKQKEEGKNLKEAWALVKEKKNDQMTQAFIQRFFETKKNKDFGWCKTFQETYSVTENENTMVKENYMTLPYTETLL